ncbi:hypothetical protein HDU99_008930, partial [Rhizoclosmatium hyalinum]
MDFDDEVVGEVSDVPVTPEDLGDNCDIQGIAWVDFQPTTRDSFRVQRITNTRNYRNCSTPHSEIAA